MAELVFKDCFFSVGTTAAPVTLSSAVRSLTIDYSAEVLDKTAMKNDSRRRIAGLKDWSVTVEFNQNYAASQVDATLFDYIGSTSKRLNIRPTTALAAAGNPRFYGLGLMESYSPVGGSVGDLAVTSVTFRGDGDLTRAVTS